MKNNLLKYGIVGSVIAFMALPVFAATLSLSPANVSVKKGQIFNAVITLNPQGVKNYTAKVELKYPANLLEVTSFSFGSQWMPVSQPGYDTTDNVNGVLVKTAGYPGGAISSVVFGTVSFRAKNTGNGTVSVGSNTAVYDAGSINVLSGSSGVSVAISSAPVATATPTATPSTNQPTPTPTLTVSPSPSVQAATEPAVQQATLLGAIGSIVSLGTGNAWLGIIVVLIVAYTAYYFIKKRRK